MNSGCQTLSFEDPLTFLKIEDILTDYILKNTGMFTFNSVGLLQEQNAHGF